MISAVNSQVGRGERRQAGRGGSPVVSAVNSQVGRGERRRAGRGGSPVVSAVESVKSGQFQWGQFPTASLANIACARPFNGSDCSLA